MIHPDSERLVSLDQVSDLVLLRRFCEACECGDFKESNAYHTELMIRLGKLHELEQVMRDGGINDQWD